MSTLNSTIKGTDISAVEVKVTDDLAQRSADCTILFAAPGSFPPPPVEFALPGDSQTLTSTTLRPSGSIITVNTSYSGIPSHAIFRGLIEFMDDTNDHNRDVWTIKMSAMPKGQPHRKVVTRVFNSFFTDKSEATSSGNILGAVCREAALQIGRNDLPSYAIVGTFDVLHQTPVQVAETLAQPFNLFDYLKYHVRTDADGMQILKVDFSADPKGGVYEIPNVISTETTFEQYMPENRVGDGNILLTGGDIIVLAGGPDAASNHTAVVTKEFTSSTQDDQTMANFTRWAERRVSIEFHCRWDGADVSNSDLDALILALKSGSISNLQITESYTLSDETFEYDSVNGLIRSTHSYFTYDTKSFQDSTYLTSVVTRKVLTHDETQEYIYPRGTKFNKSMTRRTYAFNEIGIQTAIATYSYFGVRGEWVLNDVHTDQGDIVGATNAEIQFYTANKKSLNSQPVQADAANVTGVIRATKTQIGKYQLLNGQILPVLSKDLLAHPFDPNLNFALAAFERQSAFQINGPNMEYDGLYLLDAIVGRQRYLERNNAYWVSHKIKCSINTIPAVGASVRAKGLHGYVTHIDHDLDSNTALSTIHVKRLVVK